MNIKHLQLVHDEKRKKVAVFTVTRSEYGLLYWLLQDIHHDAQLELQLLVSGSHLSPQFGETYHQIEDDGLPIAAKIESLLSSNSAVGTIKSMGLGMIGAADTLARLQPDVIVILGDGFENFAIAQAAMILKIPILHLDGGEVTPCPNENTIRHAISKLSDWHGTATQEYRQRLIQLGEHPSRIKVVGALGLEHIRRHTLLTREQLSEQLGFALTRPFFIVSYHPMKAAIEDPKSSFDNILKILDHFSSHQVIFTYPYHDQEGRYVIDMINDYVQQEPKRAFASKTWRIEDYLSAISHCDAMLGNSSRGIIEAPSLNVPSVNIGMRHKTRTHANSVIQATTAFESILVATMVAIEKRYPNADKPMHNPYFQQNSNQDIIDMIKSISSESKPPFYDLPFEPILSSSKSR